MPEFKLRLLQLRKTNSTSKLLSLQEKMLLPLRHWKKQFLLFKKLRTP